MFLKKNSIISSGLTSVHEGVDVKGGGGFSLLGEGCTFSGKMFLHGEVRIGGSIEGTISSDGIVVIEESARVNGNIIGINIQIQGCVEGNIQATGLLLISSKGRVGGDITVNRLVVEDGARINGKVSYASEKIPTQLPGKVAVVTKEAS